MYTNKLLGSMYSMVKNILLPVVISFSSFATVAAAQQTDREENDLVGLVKTVNIETAKIQLDESGSFVEWQKVILQKTSYDVKGKETEVIYYNPDGSFARRIVNTYDSKGDKIEDTEYNLEGLASSSEVYTYDRKARKTKIAEYNGVGLLEGWWIYMYNMKGSLIKMEHFDADGVPTCKWSYVYDTKGKKIMEILSNLCHSPTHIARKKTYSYDAKGNIIEVAFYESPRGGFIGKRIYRYNTKGSIIEESYYLSDGELKEKIIYDYEYDANGNWTRRVASRMDGKVLEARLEPFEVTYRTILYY